MGRGKQVKAKRRNGVIRIINNNNNNNNSNNNNNNNTCSPQDPRFAN